MFDRIISVDWSGAASETKGVDLRIAAFDTATNQSRIVSRPHPNRTVVSWSRQAFRAWIVKELHDKRPTLVAMDFGFGLPWGADQAVFGVVGWREMIRTIAKRYEENGTPRATAQAINAEERFGGHGPYRFDDSRNDFRFYGDNGIAYYRLIELIAPQGITAAIAQEEYCRSYAGFEGRRRGETPRANLPGRKSVSARARYDGGCATIRSGIIVRLKMKNCHPSVPM